MIILDDVCFAYDDRPILSHLTETIEPGQAVLLTGPNGSGKSTLLRLLNGLIFPQLGTYTFDGTVITAAKMRDHRYSKWFHQRIGYIWQHPDSQLFCSSVREELAFGPVQMGLPSEEVKKRVDDAMDLLGLTKLADRAPYSLSGGEKEADGYGLHPDHESPDLDHGRAGKLPRCRRPCLVGRFPAQPESSRKDPHRSDPPRRYHRKDYR